MASSCTKVESGGESGHSWLWARLPNVWGLPRLVSFSSSQNLSGWTSDMWKPFDDKIVGPTILVVTKWHWADASPSGCYTAKRSYPLCLAAQVLILILMTVYQNFPLARRPGVECSGKQKGKQQWSSCKLGMGVLLAQGWPWSSIWIIQ